MPRGIGGGPSPRGRSGRAGGAGGGGRGRSAAAREGVGWCSGCFGSRGTGKRWSRSSRAGASPRFRSGSPRARKSCAREKSVSAEPASVWDVVIVGAGPAGLFAARALGGKLRVLVLEEKGRTGGGGGGAEGKPRR